MTSSQLAMIVAASENDVIGNENDLPWRLSADLKRFKSLTMGHHIIMGRKTYESIGRLLPGRTTVIVTRQSNYTVKGAIIANSIEEAINACSDDPTPFIVGGAEIYNQAISFVHTIHLTRVNTNVEGDTALPPIDWSLFELIDSKTHSADDRNEFDVTFETYQRK